MSFVIIKPHFDCELWHINVFDPFFWFHSMVADERAGFASIGFLIHALPALNPTLPLMFSPFVDWYFPGIELMESAVRHSKLPILCQFHNDSFYFWGVEKPSNIWETRGLSHRPFGAKGRANWVCLRRTVINFRRLNLHKWIYNWFWIGNFLNNRGLCMQLNYFNIPAHEFITPFQSCWKK